MIGWLQSIDVSLFRFINSSLSNSFFDWLMPFVSDSPLFPCLLLAVIILLVWRGGARGRLCALMLLLSLCLGNWLIVNSIKIAVARPRPFLTLPGVILRIGKGGSFSMPSSHAANWFSAAMVLFVYYRRTAWAILPVAALVGISRIYNGVHYPSDVVAGAVLGAGYSAAIVWLCDALWQFLGQRWFPLWKAQLPSLIQPVLVSTKTDSLADRKLRDAQWLRLGGVLAFALMLIRLVYLASGKIELSEDEAYQWVWSKHPALSYYSKPVLIALTQFVSTHLWGDTEFGVRFFSPIITAVMSLLILRFMGRHVSGRTAFILLLVMSASPLLALGSIVMTVDPLSVLFWTAALIAGWSAAQAEGKTRDWLWVGLWTGLGLLSKYTNLVQLACWALFFFLWPAARTQLRKSGPWLALGIVAVCSLPIVIWNSQNGWITVKHVASDGQFGQIWHRTYVTEFLMLESAVLNPVFFIGAIWAAIGFWRLGRRDPFQLYLFSMGAPLFLMYFGLSFHNRVLANWIVPSVVPLFCLMAVYWSARWEKHIAILKPLLSIAIGAGVIAVVIAHDTQLIGKLVHRRLPSPVDPMHRVMGWKETAQVVERAREKVEKQGKPAFIICDHYGMTGQLSFYLPEARRDISASPLVYFRVTPTPENQFYFWPNFLNRTGQNAIFVVEAQRPRLVPGWFLRWWHHEPDLFVDGPSSAPPVPPEVRKEFQSIEDMGIKNVIVNGNLVRRLQLYECRNLRGS